MTGEELEAAIRKSVGMRERDQHDAMIDFGNRTITAAELKSLSDKSRELFIKDLVRIANLFRQGATGVKGLPE